MSDKRSVIAFGHYRDGEQRFEYFVVGISTALCAYVGQTLQPEKLGLSPFTLELASLLLIVASIVIGFKRIEAGLMVNYLNHRVLHLGEIRGQFVAARGTTILNEESGETLNPVDIERQLQEIGKELPLRNNEMKRWQARLRRHYKWRNWLLLLGFCGLVLAKALAPYVTKS